MTNQPLKVKKKIQIKLSRFPPLEMFELVYFHFFKRAINTYCAFSRKKQFVLYTMSESTVRDEK